MAHFATTVAVHDGVAASAIRATMTTSLRRAATTPRGAARRERRVRAGRRRRAQREADAGANARDRGGADER